MKTDYVMRKVVLDSSNVKDFFDAMDNKRDIREGKVNKLASSMNSGKHFESPFVVNIIDGVNKRLIDGNHRLKAIKLAMAKNPNFRIEVKYAEYKDKNPDEEKGIYETWNIGTSQSTDDFLKVWFDTIPNGHLMLRRIPCSIYGSTNKVKLKLIVGSHICAKRCKSEDLMFSGGYSGGKEKVVSDVSDQNVDDITNMAEFIGDMQRIFGRFDKKNTFWKSTSIQALYMIWYDNRHIPSSKFVSAISRLLVTDNPTVVQSRREKAQASGLSATKNFYREMIDLIRAEIKPMRTYHNLRWVHRSYDKAEQI